MGKNEINRRGEWRNEAVKVCKLCGDNFWPRANESRPSWASRVACGMGCNVMLGNKGRGEAERRGR